MPAARRTRDETKNLMLDAGVEVLLRDGIGIGASTFRYRDAFELLATRGIKVTRGSVHERIWSSQLAWQLDVLSELIERNEEERQLKLADAIGSRLASMPTATSIERQTVFSEAARLGSLIFIEEVVDTPAYRLFPTLVATWKASANDIPERQRLGEILSQNQQRATDRLRADLLGLITYLDMRPHPRRGLDRDEAIRAFCATSSAIGYSHTIRIGDDPRLTDDVMMPGPDGVVRRWNLLGVANWIIGRQLFVDREWSADQTSRDQTGEEPTAS